MLERSGIISGWLTIEAITWLDIKTFPASIAVSAISLSITLIEVKTILSSKSQPLLQG